ncbi:hypothetical protein AA106555_0088 [Neokomagataea thailandica NBRC 106555]|uniref:histidine kinase n=2 Tax=Neokomagataea TaxID=1223423 RepID=A0A4Y6V8Y6_9PROT|nr:MULTISPECIES: histidine kinase dimerization/phospho-acceptor domain-containing protein [Neokomagataea]QDH24835.1 sensor histidine kinase [Neokomagataea tanensis]GBR50099.1 hypothetical protein AA106555_0088 [Neokomagataea thailandica NBRC 106555]
MADSSQNGAARVRHDVRNALASALLSADILESHPDPNVQEHAATVIQSIERALNYLKSSS